MSGGVVGGIPTTKAEVEEMMEVALATGNAEQVWMTGLRYMHVLGDSPHEDLSYYASSRLFALCDMNHLPDEQRIGCAAALINLGGSVDQLLPQYNVPLVMYATATVVGTNLTKYFIEQGADLSVIEPVKGLTTLTVAVLQQAEDLILLICQRLRMVRKLEKIINFASNDHLTVLDRVTLKMATFGKEGGIGPEEFEKLVGISETLCSFGAKTFSEVSLATPCEPPVLPSTTLIPDSNPRLVATVVPGVGADFEEIDLLVPPDLTAPIVLFDDEMPPLLPPPPLVSTAFSAAQPWEDDIIEAELKALLTDAKPAEQSNLSVSRSAPGAVAVVDPTPTRVGAANAVPAFSMDLDTFRHYTAAAKAAVAHADTTVFDALCVRVTREDLPHFERMVGVLLQIIITEAREEETALRLFGILDQGCRGRMPFNALLDALKQSVLRNRAQVFHEVMNALLSTYANGEGRLEERLPFSPDCLLDHSDQNLERFSVLTSEAGVRAFECAQRIRQGLSAWLCSADMEKLMPIKVLDKSSAQNEEKLALLGKDIASECSPSLQRHCADGSTVLGQLCAKAFRDFPKEAPALIHRALCGWLTMGSFLTEPLEVNQVLEAVRHALEGLQKELLPQQMLAVLEVQVQEDDFGDLILYLSWLQSFFDEPTAQSKQLHSLSAWIPELKVSLEAEQKERDALAASLARALANFDHAEAVEPVLINLSALVQDKEKRYAIKRQAIELVDYMALFSEGLKVEMACDDSRLLEQVRFERCDKQAAKLRASLCRERLVVDLVEPGEEVAKAPVVSSSPAQPVPSAAGQLAASEPAAQVASPHAQIDLSARPPAPVAPAFLAALQKAENFPLLCLLLRESIMAVNLLRIEVLAKQLLKDYDIKTVAHVFEEAISAAWEHVSDDRLSFEVTRTMLKAFPAHVDFCSFIEDREQVMQRRVHETMVLSGFKTEVEIHDMLELVTRVSARMQLFKEWARAEEEPAMGITSGRRSLNAS